MKTLFSTFAILITFAALAQVDTVDGKAYQYLKAYEEHNSLLSGTFMFKEIMWEYHYNAYKLVSTKPKAKRKVLKYGIWMVETDMHFYVNIMRYGYKDMFIKFKKFGNYYYFKAQRQLSPQQKNTNSGLYMFGAVGGAVAGVINETNKSDNWHAVLDLDKDAAYYLTREFIEDLLINYPYLNEEFKNEKDKEDIEVLKLYLEKVNEKYETSFPTQVHME